MFRLPERLKEIEADESVVIAALNALPDTTLLVLLLNNLITEYNGQVRIMNRNMDILKDLRKLSND